MGWLLGLLERVRLFEPEGSRQDAMPEIAPLGDERVDLGRCDVHELLLVIEDVFPQDAVLRLAAPSGEMREFLETHALAANRSLYDLPLDNGSFREFQALAATSGGPRDR